MKKSCLYKIIDTTLLFKGEKEREREFAIWYMTHITYAHWFSSVWLALDNPVLLKKVTTYYIWAIIICFECKMKMSEMEKRYGSYFGWILTIYYLLSVMICYEQNMETSK